MPRQQSADEHRMEAVHGSGHDRMVVSGGQANPGTMRREEWDQHQPDEQTRLVAALRAARHLAFPPTAPAVGLALSDEEVHRAAVAAEEDILRGLVHVLADLVAGQVGIFVGGDAGWRSLTEVGTAASATLGAVSWPDFPAGNVAIASASRHPHVWVALGPWREQSAPEYRKAALLPVVVGNELRAVAVAPLADETRDDAAMVAVAAAAAGYAAAGIQALRLEQRAQAEGRARDAYISLAAHELRNPLTSIKGYSQLLLRQARKNPISESMRHSIESIEQQSVRMAEMVGEMLDASRIQRGRLDISRAPTDLVPLVRRVVERRMALYPQHELTLEADAPTLIGHYDAGRVEQVLRDLIDNAARHTPSGGAVSVRLAREGADAVVSVRDRGIGVPEADRERIFDYLYRTRASEQRNLSGLGLGLFVSRGLIERMGGRLTLQASRTDEPSGSEFRFSLPLA